MSHNSHLARLLGEELVTHQGNHVSVKELTSPVIGLYFSAGFCSSSKVFDDQLTTFYDNFQKNPDLKNSFSIVFISCDRSEAHFDEHFQRLSSFFALRFGDRARKKHLSRIYRAHKIPKLVLIDRQTLELITLNGKDNVLEDPDGKKFPWKPCPLVELLNDGRYLTNDDSSFDFNSFGKCYKGLYFSAHWCPPCKALTPQLAETYKKVRDRGENFEIIFISSDRSEMSFKQYFSTMPWKAVPYEEADRRKDLALQYQVEGIPTLIILDENNELITKDARFEVMDDPGGECFPWYPRLVDELTEKYSDKMDQDPCVILFTEEEELDAAFRTLQPVAQDFLDPKRIKNNSDVSETGANYIRFFCGGDGEFCESLRDFFELDDHVPLLVIIDIPEGKKYILEDDAELSTDVIKNFVNRYLIGELEGYPVRSQLS